MTIIIDRNIKNKKIPTDLKVEEIKEAIKKLSKLLLFIPYKPVRIMFKDFLIIRKSTRIVSVNQIVDDLILFKIVDKKARKIHVARIHKDMNIEDIAITYLNKITNTAAIVSKETFLLEKLIKNTTTID